MPGVYKDKLLEMPDEGTRVKKDIFPVLSPSVRDILKGLSDQIWKQVEEIRLRKKRPLQLCTELGEIFAGEERPKLKSAYEVKPEDVHQTLQFISQSSIYALEDEFRNGYLTISGGHRVGFVGEAVLNKGQVKTLKNISGLNIRLAREVKGCANSIFTFILDQKSWEPYRTLIMSPPRCGKTTLLRDLIRLLSDGDPLIGFTGVNVGVVDERSEIAGCYRGVPQNDVGKRSDVLDKCPKAEGMIMLLRSMAPRVIATDEIGRPADAEALIEILNAGVGVLATVHASSFEELKQRPCLQQLLKEGIFQRIIVLSRGMGVGTVESIIDGTTGKNLLRRPLRLRQGGN